MDFGSESIAMCVNDVLDKMKWKRYVWSFPILFCVEGFFGWVFFYYYMWVSVATLFAVACLADTATISFLGCQVPIA